MLDIPVPLAPELNPTEFDEKAEALLSAIESMTDVPHDIVLTCNMMDIVPRHLSFTPMSDDEQRTLGAKHRVTVVVNDLFGLVPLNTVTVELHPLVNDPSWVDDDVREHLLSIIAHTHGAACAEVIGAMADMIGWDAATFVTTAETLGIAPADVLLVILARVAQFEMWKLLENHEIPQPIRAVMEAQYGQVVARNDEAQQTLLDKHRPTPVAQPARTAVNDGRWN